MKWSIRRVQNLVEVDTGFVDLTPGMSTISTKPSKGTSFCTEKISCNIIKVIKISLPMRLVHAMKRPKKKKKAYSGNGYFPRPSMLSDRNPI